jgi:hypothetical protein
LAAAVVVAADNTMPTETVVEVVLVVIALLL